MSRPHLVRSDGSGDRWSCAVRSWSVALALLLGVLPGWAGGTTLVVPAASQEIDVGCGTSDTDIVFDAARGVSIERFRGQAARTHLLNLMARHPAQFAKAHAAMSDRGATPTEEVFVLRSLALADPVTESSSTPGLVPQSVVIGDASGEMVFWSWDDGDPNTWEGQIYVAHYAEQYEGIYDIQFVVASAPFSLSWASLVWQSHDPWNQFPDAAVDGGDSQGYDPELAMNRSFLSRASQSQEGMLPLSGGPSGPPQDPRSQVYWDCWINGVSDGCAYGVLACVVGAALGGVGFPVCVAVECGVGVPLYYSYRCLITIW